MALAQVPPRTELPTTMQGSQSSIAVPETKSSKSAPGTSRRHSLPIEFHPPGLWSNNGSHINLVVESEEAARGEHILDEAAIAHRLSALRQLNGGSTSSHRYAKSTGARNSTFSQPVIVRTYSGAARPRSYQREPNNSIRRDNGMARTAPQKSAKLPPIEAFTFKGIMEEIKHDVSEDLERIAEICARSRYSLSNQYEVHMPPHGRGDPILRTAVSVGEPSSNTAGPTLQAIESDDEQPRLQGRVSRGPRRTRSAAYGTLETIMSSSRSSDEDQTKKKSAVELAEEVRGRVTEKKKNSMTPQKTVEVLDDDAAQRKIPGRIRSKSTSFASIIIDNAHASKEDTDSQSFPSTSLLSEPARPKTSVGSQAGRSLVSNDNSTRRSQDRTLSARSSMLGAGSTTTWRPSAGIPTIMESISSWLPWKKAGEKAPSHAEGSLRHLLQSTDPDRTGEQVETLG